MNDKLTQWTADIIHDQDFNDLSRDVLSRANSDLYTLGIRDEHLLRAWIEKYVKFIDDVDRRVMYHGYMLSVKKNVVCVLFFKECTTILVFDTVQKLTNCYGFFRNEMTHEVIIEYSLSISPSYYNRSTNGSVLYLDLEHLMLFPISECKNYDDFNDSLFEHITG